MSKRTQRIGRGYTTTGFAALQGKYFSNLVHKKENICEDAMKGVSKMASDVVCLFKEHHTSL